MISKSELNFFQIGVIKERVKIVEIRRAIVKIILKIYTQRKAPRNVITAQNAYRIVHIIRIPRDCSCDGKQSPSVVHVASYVSKNSAENDSPTTSRLLFFLSPCIPLLHDARSDRCAPRSRGVALFYCPNEQCPVRSSKVVKAASLYGNAAVKRKKRIAWIITLAITRCT